MLREEMELLLVGKGARVSELEVVQELVRERRGEWMASARVQRQLSSNLLERTL